MLRVVGALLNLTGPVQRDTLEMILPTLPGVGLRLQVVQRTLREEDAAWKPYTMWRISPAGLMWLQRPRRWTNSTPLCSIDAWQLKCPPFSGLGTAGPLVSG